MTKVRVERIVAAVLTAMLLPAVLWATCGAAAVCGDVSASLMGVFEGESVTITWSTSNENNSVGVFKILRYNCSTPSTCSVAVATVTRAGSCGVNHDYSYTDTPPSPASQWVYTVEVWKVDNTRQCGVDTTPQ